MGRANGAAKEVAEGAEGRRVVSAPVEGPWSEADVERVAAALWNDGRRPASVWARLEHHDEPLKQLYRQMARAALTAALSAGVIAEMREVIGGLLAALGHLGWDANIFVYDDCPAAVRARAVLARLDGKEGTS